VRMPSVMMETAAAENQKEDPFR
jgi:hypothetical protein